MIMTHTIETSDGAALHVETEGSEFLPALMLSNSLGTDLNLWGFQVQEFAKRFRVVRYDRRGHGRSSLGNAPRTMETLGRDALAIMDTLGLDKVNWCGISMGGMVGQWLGANAPERIDKLILSNTSAYFPNRAPWDNRIKAIRDNGLDSIADAIMAIWFTADFRAHDPETVTLMRAMLCATPVEGYIASCETVRDMDLRAWLPSITAPTLIIAGKHDLSTPVEAAEYIRAHIRSAALTVLDAAHITNVELPAAYTELVMNFLAQPTR
jgi:3-oxoadipate enol-lactonase